MKKLKKPGDNISLKTKKNESSIIVDWINCQSNLMDSIRYLIEKETMQNGVRNLQNHIPAERTLSVNADSGSSTQGLSATGYIAEIAATQDQNKQSDPAIQVQSLATNESIVNKASAKTAAEDDIDEDDIESWL